MLTPDAAGDQLITMTLAEYRADMRFAADIGGDIAMLRDATEKLRESIREDG